MVYNIFVWYITHPHLPDAYHWYTLAQQNLKLELGAYLDHLLVAMSISYITSIPHVSDNQLSGISIFHDTLQGYDSRNSTRKQ